MSPWSCAHCFVHWKIQKPSDFVGDLEQRLNGSVLARGRRNDQIDSPIPVLYEVGRSAREWRNSGLIRSVLELEEQFAQLSSRCVELRMAVPILADVLAALDMEIEGETFISAAAHLPRIQLHRGSRPALPNQQAFIRRGPKRTGLRRRGGPAGQNGLN